MDQPVEPAVAPAIEPAVVPPAQAYDPSTNLLQQAQDSMMARQIATENRQKIDADLKKTSIILLIAFLLGWLGLLIRLISTRGNLGIFAVTSTAFIWTLAWVSGGFLFGFIFGIPKVITATTSSTNPALNRPSEASNPKLKVNTNLEDISDWLTKVLVGATLTQLSKIPGAVNRAAYFMALGEFSSTPSFNAALIVYYSSLGFLAGYILTRMFFARAFESVD